MGLRTIPFDNFNSVGAGQLATLNLGTNWDFFALYLKYKGNVADMLAGVDEIKLKINGKTIREFTPAQAKMIAEINGVDLTGAVYLPIFFAEPWRRTPQGEDNLAWRMGDVSNFTVEVQVKSGQTNPTLSGYAEVMPSTGQAFGTVIHWRRFSYTAPGGGVQAFRELPKELPYLRIHADSQHINGIKVERDREVIHDASTAINEQTNANRGLVNQASVYSLAFDRTQRLGDAFGLIIGPNSRLASEFVVKFDMAQTDEIELLTETLGPR